MSVNKLIQLVSNAANGTNNLEQSAIGCKGYGFVFIDTQHTNISFTKMDGGRVLTYIGFREKILRLFYPNIVEFSAGAKWKLPIDIGIIIGGHLKTLLPNLEFGGHECWFGVWMLVKTPDDNVFPAFLGHYQSGPTIDCWDPDNLSYYTGKPIIETIPEDFLSVINFWLSDFDSYEAERLEEALLGALMSITTTDYHAVYGHDHGNSLMGIAEGRPFIRELGFEYTDEDIKKALDFARIVAIGQDSAEFGKLLRD